MPLPRMTTPITRNRESAPTLTSENQNSISPNHFTPTRFITVTMLSATSANSHCGTSENIAQYFMYRATAVISTMPVMAQFRKNIQPATNAACSPRNSRA